MASYWPTATTVFAPAMNEIPKAVFSKRGEAILEAPRLAESVVTNAASFKRQAGAGSWAEATVLDGDLAEDVARLKAEDGKPIIAHGGAVLARSLIAENLVDRYMLMVYPIVLGRGAAILSDIAAPRPLELVSTKVFPKGAMAQIYRPG
jgi:dihydrofolate reductase